MNTTISRLLFLYIQNCQDSHNYNKSLSYLFKLKGTENFVKRFKVQTNKMHLTFRECFYKTLICLAFISFM